MDGILLDFQETTRRVLKDLLGSEDGELIVYRDGRDLAVESRYDLCYTWRLTLTEVSGLPEDVQDSWTLWCSDLKRDGERYVLIGDVDRPDQKDAFAVELRFSGAAAEIKAVRWDPVQAYTTPWWILSCHAVEILRKFEVAPQLMNARERELLPLLQEVAVLTGWQEPSEPVRFPLLRDRLDPKLHGLLDRVERHEANWKKHQDALNKLLRQLNSGKHEHIWRSIYEQVAASQADYPLKCCADEATRLRIEKTLHGLGYTGSYPDFVKRGSVDGLHVRESHGQTYFVFNEKNAVFHIHCVEHQSLDGEVQMEFVCGTELLKKGETPGDILGCLFSTGGRRFITTVVCSGEEELAQKLRIADKKARFSRLTRAERKSEGTINGFVLFALFFLFGGGILALFSLGFFMAISILITALVLGWGEVPAMLAELPWWRFFCLAWGLFGGAMGVVTVLGDRNK